SRPRARSLSPAMTCRRSSRAFPFECGPPRSLRSLPPKGVQFAPWSGPAALMDASHVPVLLNEAIEALSMRADGTYVHATFGRGGHSRGILRALGESGRLIAIDRDPEAANAAQRIADARFTFRHAWFSELPAVLAGLSISRVDGAILDLGFSSPQIADP